MAVTNSRDRVSFLRKRVDFYINPLKKREVKPTDNRIQRLISPDHRFGFESEIKTRYLMLKI